jgi:6-phosphogluconolactonase
MLTRRAFGIAAAGAASQLLTAAEKEQLVYIGTYTRGGSKGIYVYRFNPASGKLTEVGVAAETPSPSFLWTTPDGKRIYCVGEAQTGTVTAFNIDRASGKLTKINVPPRCRPDRQDDDRRSLWLGKRSGVPAES